MKEQKSILKAYHALDKKQKASIATVVKVRGSSYRSPGARMLITDDGKWVGSISGGCLEGDALRKAREVMSTNKPLTVTYDTREESNQNLGIGLGCNGIIEVFIEPLLQDQTEGPIFLFEKIGNSQKPSALATIFNGSGIGERILISSESDVQDFVSDRILANQIKEDLKMVFTSAKSEVKKYENAEVFLEFIQPSISLIIFGGGFDARPVSALAKSLGWNVVVTDECVAHIAPIFFPSADKLSLCDRKFVKHDFDITPYTACVLMSHNYEYDRDVLKEIIVSSAPYIGILGPRNRFDKMLAEIENSVMKLSETDLHRIHSPIGLDIGAEAADEIAISIIAEIQSKFSNRSGGFLKYNQGPIHDREKNSDQVFKQVYLGLDSKSKVIGD